MAEHLGSKRLGYSKKAHQTSLANKTTPAASEPAVERKPRVNTGSMPPPEKESLSDAGFFDRPARQRHDIEKRIALIYGADDVVQELRTIEKANKRKNPEISRRALEDSRAVTRAFEQMNERG